MPRKRLYQVLALAMATLVMVTIISFIEKQAVSAEQTITVYKTPT